VENLVTGSFWVPAAWVKMRQCNPLYLARRRNSGAA
jgi:hypothetical protein